MGSVRQRDPLVRTGDVRSAGHPMSGTDTGARRFGTGVAGPPPTVKTQSQSRPPWFRNVGGGAPRQGFMGTVGMPNASRAGPDDAVKMDPSPDMPVDVMGLMTNATVPHAKIARRLQHQLTDAPHKYQVLMTFHERRDPVLPRTIKRETRRYTMLSIQAFNFMQALTTKMPAHARDVPDADDLLSDWSFEGIVRTEEGGKEMRQRRGDVSMERLFNSVVRGYAYTFNTFNPNIVPGTRLYLIVKKSAVDSDNAFGVRPWDGGEKVEDTGKLSNLPFQVFYYANPAHDVPPLSALEYHTEHGHREYGRFIYIGRASTHTPVMANYREFKKSAHNVQIALQQPQFNVFVDW